jgi:single-strand DNA-binding protein
MLIGEVSERPELRFTPEGTAVACFSIAVTRVWSGPGGRAQREAEHFSVVAWRELAERCEEDLEPGDCIYLEGRLRNHTWRDMLGRQMSRTDVVAERVAVLQDEDGSEPEGRPDGRYDYELQWRD